MLRRFNFCSVTFNGASPLQHWSLCRRHASLPARLKVLETRDSHTALAFLIESSDATLLKMSSSNFLNDDTFWSLSAQNLIDIGIDPAAAGEVILQQMTFKAERWDLLKDLSSSLIKLVCILGKSDFLVESRRRNVKNHVTDKFIFALLRVRPRTERSLRLWSRMVRRAQAAHPQLVVRFRKQLTQAIFEVGSSVSTDDCVRIYCGMISAICARHADTVGIAFDSQKVYDTLLRLSRFITEGETLAMWCWCVEASISVNPDRAVAIFPTPAMRDAFIALSRLVSNPRTAQSFFSGIAAMCGAGPATKCHTEAQNEFMNPELRDALISLQPYATTELSCVWFLNAIWFNCYGNWAKQHLFSTEAMRDAMLSCARTHLLHSSSAQSPAMIDVARVFFACLGCFANSSTGRCLFDCDEIRDLFVKTQQQYLQKKNAGPSSPAPCGQDQVGVFVKWWAGALTRLAASSSRFRTREIAECIVGVLEYHDNAHTCESVYSLLCCMRAMMHRVDCSSTRRTFEIFRCSRVREFLLYSSRFVPTPPQNVSSEEMAALLCMNIVLPLRTMARGTNLKFSSPLCSLDILNMVLDLRGFVSMRNDEFTSMVWFCSALGHVTRAHDLHPLASSPALTNKIRSVFIDTTKALVQYYRDCAGGSQNQQHTASHRGLSYYVSCVQWICSMLGNVAAPELSTDTNNPRVAQLLTPELLQVIISCASPCSTLEYASQWWCRMVAFIVLSCEEARELLGGSDAFRDAHLKVLLTALASPVAVAYWIRTVFALVDRHATIQARYATPEVRAALISIPVAQMRSACFSNVTRWFWVITHLSRLSASFANDSQLRDAIAQLQPLMQTNLLNRRTWLIAVGSCINNRRDVQQLFGECPEFLDAMMNHFDALDSSNPVEEQSWLQTVSSMIVNRQVTFAHSQRMQKIVLGYCRRASTFQDLASATRWLSVASRMARVSEPAQVALAIRGVHDVLILIFGKTREPAVSHRHRMACCTWWLSLLMNITASSSKDVRRCFVTPQIAKCLEDMYPEARGQKLAYLFWKTTVRNLQGATDDASIIFRNALRLLG